MTPTTTQLQGLVTTWRERIASNRRLAEQHQHGKSARDHRNALAAVFEARAKELELALRDMRELVDGPVTARCRCGRRIQQTPAGTWKHCDRLPMTMTNHLARPT